MLSIRAYARHRGVSHTAVQKAIDSGRISVIPGKNGRVKIDPEVADIQWAKNTRPDQQERGSLKDFEKTQNDLLNMSEGAPLNAGAKEVQTSGLSREKSETEIIRRQMMELQLAKTRGELVNIADVERALASKILSANESLNSLVDRIAPILAAETDVNEVDKVLRFEIRRAMSLIAQEAPAVTQ